VTIYEVVCGYCVYRVVLDEITTDMSVVVDKLIDNLEEEGYTGCFCNPDDYNEDEYVIGGNHSLALLHHGNFQIHWSQV
jgi:hypothetical protein